jgi:DNA-binding IclR family transcriptional regulator
MTDGEQPLPRVQSLGKALAILQAIARSGSGLKAVQVMRVTGLSKQATHHILHSLITLGLLQRTENGGYVLGLAMGELATAFERQFEAPPRLVRAVREVAEETGEAAYLSGWWNHQIVILFTSRGARVMQPSELRSGAHGDAHARASGKLLLALSDERVLSDFLATNAFRPRTPRTITNVETFRSCLMEIRQAGFAVDYEEFAQDLCCIAVPVQIGSEWFALAVSWPTSRFEADRERYIETLKRHGGITTRFL